MGHRGGGRGPRQERGYRCFMALLPRSLLRHRLPTTPSSPARCPFPCLWRGCLQGQTVVGAWRGSSCAGPTAFPSLLAALVMGWFRSGTSKAYLFGRFVADGGRRVVLVGYRGGFTMPVPSAMGFEDGCHLPLMMLGQKPAQFCAGPMTTTPEGVVFLPRGVVVRSRGTSLFFLAIALCHIDRRGFLGVLVGCWILAITRGISLLQSSSSLADWDGGSLSFS